MLFFLTLHSCVHFSVKSQHTIFSQRDCFVARSAELCLQVTVLRMLLGPLEFCTVILSWWGQCTSHTYQPFCFYNNHCILNLFLYIITSAFYPKLHLSGFFKDKLSAWLCLAVSLK